MKSADKNGEKIKLFRQFPDSCAACSKKKKVLMYVFYIALMLLATLSLGVCSLLMAYGTSYSYVIFLKYFTNALVVFLNLFPPVALFILLYGIIGTAWIAYLIDCVIVLGFSAANHFMLMFRNDPLMFSDVLYVREAMEISKEGYNYRITPEIAFSLAVCLFFTVVLFVFRCKRLKSHVGIYAACLAVLSTMLLADTYLDEDVYNAHTNIIDARYMNIWSPTNQYLSRGFVYPFIHSVSVSLETPPEGYDEQRAESRIEAYRDSSIPEDKKVNVVGIMLEAYSDLETLGIWGIDEEAYRNYRKIRDENLSGTLVTNIFAAGTIDSERGFLTGFTGLEHCRRNINSYVRYFNSQGYNTWGSHPSEDWFYNRRNVNSYIGFDEYLFKENYYEDKYGEYDMRYDSIVFEEIYNQYVERVERQNGPYFGFHVTYQGHGPYATDSMGWGTADKPLYVNPYVSETSSNIINNYLGSLRNTGENLRIFVERMKARPEPVIVVLFGDHKPWLGDSNSVYNELGISFDLSTKDGFMNYYCTEYVIIANDAAKEVLGRDFEGKGPVTSPCFLMNVLFDEMGLEGPKFMKYTNEVRKNITAVNESGILDSHGNFYTLEFMPDSLKAIYDEYVSAEYYERNNFRK